MVFLMADSGSDHDSLTSTVVPSANGGSSSSDKSEFHLALAVTNVKNSIPFKLEMKKDHYGMSVELFETHARSTRVLHHIIPQDGKEPPAPTDATYEQWVTLDSTVK